MGTTSEWTRVLLEGGLWGMLMLLWQAVTRRLDQGSWGSTLTSLAITSLLFGMGVTFRLRVFHDVRK